IIAQRKVWIVLLPGCVAGVDGEAVTAVRAVRALKDKTWQFVASEAVVEDEAHWTQGDRRRLISVVGSRKRGAVRVAGGDGCSTLRGGIGEDGGTSERS